MAASRQDRATQSNRQSVLAIVLTYSAPAALVSCIRALMSQSVTPDEVLVVDNNGNPSAERSLAEAKVEWDRVRVLREPENTGPAGGHATGLGEFLASGRDLAWVMDDDCIPDRECLEALLTAVPPGPDSVFVFPNWVSPDGDVTQYPAWCGFLVSRDVVKRVGLPRSELVWWGEDTEYLMWRIPAAGYPRQHCHAARVTHLMARAQKVRPAWKYYYEARNSVYLRLHHRRHPSRLFGTLGRLAARILLREKKPGRKLLLLGTGTMDGLRGRLGMRVPIGADLRRE